MGWHRKLQAFGHTQCSNVDENGPPHPPRLAFPLKKKQGKPRKKVLNPLRDIAVCDREVAHSEIIESGGRDFTVHVQYADMALFTRSSSHLSLHKLWATSSGAHY